MNKSSAIARNINAIRTHFGHTQTSFGDAIGVSQVTVSNWETSGHKVNDKNAQAIMDVFPVTYDDIMSEQNGFAVRVNLPHGAILPTASESAYAPLLGSVHAGEPTDEETIQDMVELPQAVLNNHPNSFFLRVEGDCMDKVYPEGCFVLIDRDRPPQNGSIAAFEDENYQAVMRRYYKGANSLILAPESNNPDHEDIILGKDSERTVTVIGTVVWFQASKEME